jgi:hypothetical protein
LATYFWLLFFCLLNRYAREIRTDRPWKDSKAEQADWLPVREIILTELRRYILAGGKMEGFLINPSPVR